jgi:hypothetical protein
MRVVASLLLALSLNCEKKSSLEVPAHPGGEAGPEEGSKGGTTLRYEARSSKYRQKATWEMTQRGAGNYAEVALELSADIDVAQQSDRLKVVWAVVGVDKLDLKGALQVEPGEDPKAFLRENGHGAYLTDLLGQADDAASQALPENADRNQEIDALREDIRKKTAAGKPVRIGAGVQLISYLPPVLQLPSLPEQPLPTGKAVKVASSEEAQIGESGLVLPIESSMTWTLVKIDASGGERIAELQFTGEATGSTQADAGRVMIESKNEGTLLFNLDKHMPITYEVSRTETFELGDFAGETTTIIRSQWDAR